MKKTYIIFILLLICSCNKSNNPIIKNPVDSNFTKLYVNLSLTTGSRISNSALYYFGSHISGIVRNNPNFFGLDSNIGPLIIHGIIQPFIYTDSINKIGDYGFFVSGIFQGYGTTNSWGILGDSVLKINKMLIEFYLPKRLIVSTNTILIDSTLPFTAENNNAISIGEQLKLKWDVDPNYSGSVKIGLIKDNNLKYEWIVLPDTGFFSTELSKLFFKIGDTISIYATRTKSRIIDTNNFQINLLFRDSLDDKIILLK